MDAPKRGRPKKIVEEPLTDTEEGVARILASYCGIPGCIPRNHSEEAKRIIELVKSRMN